MSQAKIFRRPGAQRSPKLRNPSSLSCNPRLQHMQLLASLLLCYSQSLQSSQSLLSHLKTLAVADWNAGVVGSFKVDWSGRRCSQSSLRLKLPRVRELDDLWAPGILCLTSNTSIEHLVSYIVKVQQQSTPMRASGRTIRLPGWQSAWKRPSSKIMRPYASLMRSRMSFFPSSCSAAGLSPMDSCT